MSDSSKPACNYDEIKMQRDDLLISLMEMVAIHDEPSGFEGKWGSKLDEAIIIQKEKIDLRLKKARIAIEKCL